MRASRYRRFNRPTATLAPPIVRHDVLMVPEGRPARCLHGGIALAAEATLLFDQTRREASEEPGRPFAVVLERVTVETLAIQPAGSRDVLKPAEAVTFKPSPPPPESEIRLGEVLDGLRRRIAKALLIPFRAPEVREWPDRNPLSGITSPEFAASFITVVDAPGGLVTVQTGAALAALFKLAAHHQGNGSPSGRMIAEALEVPFPLTMPDLHARAVAIGLNPKTLWPWRQVPGCTDADVAATPDKGPACSSCGRFAAFGHDDMCPHNDD